MRRGRFISFEGSEGAGKSTIIRTIADFMSASGKEYIITREPGGTKAGEKIRSLLLAKNMQFCPDTELLLMYAARAQHYHELIKPALATGTHVLSDRFSDSSFAYQGFGRKLGIERLIELDNWTLGGFKPDITVLLDLAPEKGLARAGKIKTPDRFESEDLSFYNRVRAGFLHLNARDPQRFTVIDASQPLDSVIKEVMAKLSPVIKDW